MKSQRIQDPETSPTNVEEWGWLRKEDAKVTASVWRFVNSDWRLSLDPNQVTGDTAKFDRTLRAGLASVEGVEGVWREDREQWVISGNASADGLLEVVSLVMRAQLGASHEESIQLPARRQNASGGVRKPHVVVPPKSPTSPYWVMKGQGEEEFRRAIGYKELAPEIEPELIAIIADEAIDGFDRTTAVAALVQIPGPIERNVLEWMIQAGNTSAYLCACISVIETRGGDQVLDLLSPLARSSLPTVRRLAQKVLAEREEKA